MNGILGKKLSILLSQLGGQCFVVSDNQCRFLNFLDNVCHRKSLATAGHAQKSLMFQTFFDTFHQLFNRLWLVTSWLKISFNLKIHMAVTMSGSLNQKRGSNSRILI